MQFYDSAEKATNQAAKTSITLTEEVLGDCRNHLESAQNLRHLISLEAYSPKKVMLYLRMMDWHLRNLAEILLEPRMK